MMFKPDNRSYPAEKLNINILNRAKRHPITNEDVQWLFGHGNASWIRIYKVIYKKQPWGQETRLISRDYSLPRQRDEFIGDMFDIAHYHRIVGLSEPYDLYVEETTEGTSIDAETIEAIVGKMDG